MNSKRLSRATLLMLMAISCLHASAGGGADLRAFEAVEPHMGTLFRIKLYAKSEAQAQSAFRAAFDRVSRLDETLSDYKPHSELSTIAWTSVRHPVPVSDDLFRVLSAAQKMAERTDGAFDITVGALTHLWRESRKTGRVPNSQELQSAVRRCGFRKLHLNSAKQSVSVNMPGMELDAGGIAKGYAADEALLVLRHSGVTQALVAASGDLALGDPPPGKAGWLVGVDSLDSAGQPFTRVLSLANAAVSTSGDSEQYMDKGGKRYSHILDPRTGMALTNQLTATVVAPTSTEADAAATAVSVLGRDEGLIFIEKQTGMAALFVDRAATPAKVTASRRFNRLPAPKGDGI
jgi:thiamine biosynthesis lipoprotein